MANRDQDEVTGGFDNMFRCDTDRYHCPVCLLVLRNAMQTSCGHRFCESCIDRVIGKSTMLKCPVDKQYSKLNQIFPDVAIRRDVMSLPVMCCHDDCHWTGDLRDHEIHKMRCPMEEVACPYGCNVRSKRCEVEHHRNVCPSRKIECLHCLDKVPCQNLDQHQKICLKFPTVCELCHETDIPREDLGKHADPFAGTCKEAISNCPYHIVGCSFQSKRYEMEQHVLSPSTIDAHLKIVSKIAEDQKQENASLKDQVTNLNRRIELMEGRIRRLDNKSDALKNRLNNWNVTGQLHWKIDLQNARGKYHSTDFYTGCPGYRVQITLDTESAREGATRYAGFGLTLLRGEYDDQVMWPFNATSIITVLDQKSGAKPKNFICNVVMREVPRNRTGNRFDRLCKRGMAKQIPTDDLIGQGSRFVGNGCLFVEVSVVHCVYPMPDITSSPLANLTPVSLHALQSPIQTRNSPPSPVFSLASLSVLQ